MEKMTISRGMTMKRMLYVVLAFLLMSQIAWSDDKSAAKELLTNNIEAALAVLQKKDINQQEKIEQVIKIAEPIFDFHLMAKLALGRKHWQDLSDKNREKFVDLFVAKLKATYVDKLSFYTDQKIAYETPVQKGIKIYIPTKVVSKDNSFAMMFKLYKSSNTWKIYDIEIEGVSLISTYRSQFNDILSKGTIDDLLVKLEKPENK
jgi:phospholipid transport system substrate-binding protein